MDEFGMISCDSILLIYTMKSGALQPVQLAAEERAAWLEKASLDDGGVDK